MNRILKRFFVYSIIMTSLAHAAGTSTTFVWIPTVPTGAFDIAPFDTTLRCSSFIPPVGITNATAIGWYETSGAASTNCSIGIYTASGSLIRSTGVQDCSLSGTHLVSGLSAFSLVAGVKYQECHCTDGNSIRFLQQTNALVTLDNAMAVPILSNGATACTGGAVPGSTGALTAQTVTPTTILLLSTDTP